MLGKRIINSNDAGAPPSPCTTDTNDYPTTNLAYYKMSSAADEKGTYNGTATNVNFNVAGKFGNAGNFNGSSGYISVPNSAGNNISTFSISFWFKTNGQAATGTLFNNGGADSTQTGWYISILSSGVLRFVTSQGGVNQPNNDGTTNYANNSWHNVVLVYTAVGVGTSTYNMYIDGNSTPEITGSDGRFTATSTQPLTIGRFARLAIGYFDGTIDQVRIFNSALNATQVTSLYNEVYCVPTIVPSENFNTVLYTGNGGTQSITGTGFTPNFIWTKNRSSVQSHYLFDIVRGDFKAIFSDLTNPEFSSTNYISFDSDGFTTGSTQNQNNSNYVAWSWKAGGAAVSNTDGTITSQVSANVNAGFSIVSYTGNGSAGATIGHGLNLAPELIIQKNRDEAQSWIVNADAIGKSNILTFSTGATLSRPNQYYYAWDSSTITTGSDIHTNGLNDKIIAYCLHSVDGFSKIGSYVGTGATGNTIVTGFRPAFVMIKRTNGTSDWNMWDNRRGNQSILWANGNNQEATNSAYEIIFSSNAFTVNATANFANGSGDSYIFMAFAEEGFVPDNFFNDDSTVATYKLNGDSGDDSGNGYNGTASNVTYAAGKFDEAAVFNGSSSFIDTNVNFTNFSGGDYTVSMWVNKDVDAQNFFAGTVSGTGALNGIYFRWNESTNASPNAIGFLERNTTTTATTIFSTTGYTFGQWIHVVGVRSGGTNFLYVNGTLQGSAANQNINHATDFTLGRAGAFASNAFDGSIDQVRIFNRALGSGEITALYNE